MWSQGFFVFQFRNVCNRKMDVTERWKMDVTSIFLYACELWTLTAELQRRIQAMEMRCYRKILHISYKDHVTNEEVRAMFPVHQVWLKSSCKAQWKGEEDKADNNKKRGGKTTSGNGRACSSASPRGQWRTGKNWENWLQNYLWCPNDPRG